MGAEDAFEQGGAGARQADDEDRRRAVEVVGVYGRVGVEDADQLLDQATVGVRVVVGAGAHDRVAARERLPGGVVIAEVVEFLVQGEFERGMVLAALRDLRQPRADEVDMVGLRGLPADARQRQRGAAEGRAGAQAGFHLRFGFGDIAVELQLQRMEVAEVGAVEAGIARTLHAVQCLGIQSQPLVEVAERELVGGVARSRQRRMAHAAQRGIGLADAAQAMGDAQDELRIGRRCLGGLQQPGAGIAQPSLRQQYAGEQGMCSGMPRCLGEQRFESEPRLLQPPRGGILLGLQPERMRMCVHDVRRVARCRTLARRCWTGPRRCIPTRSACACRASGHTSVRCAAFRYAGMYPHEIRDTLATLMRLRESNGAARRPRADPTTKADMAPAC